MSYPSTSSFLRLDLTDFWKSTRGALVVFAGALIAGAAKELIECIQTCDTFVREIPVMQSLLISGVTWFVELTRRLFTPYS